MPRCVSPVVKVTWNKLMFPAGPYPVWDTSGLVYINMCRSNYDFQKNLACSDPFFIMKSHEGDVKILVFTKMKSHHREDSSERPRHVVAAVRDWYWSF